MRYSPSHPETHNSHETEKEQQVESYPGCDAEDGEVTWPEAWVSEEEKAGVLLLKQSKTKS